eukprot:306826-Hanusia_phi.AAC.1
MPCLTVTDRRVMQPCHEVPRRRPAARPGRADHRIQLRLTVESDQPTGSSSHFSIVVSELPARPLIKFKCNN